MLISALAVNPFSCDQRLRQQNQTALLIGQRSLSSSLSVHLIPRCAGSFTGTPAWSPDESAVAITVSKPSYDVAVIDLSSACISQVANSDAFEAFPTWIGETSKH